MFIYDWPPTDGSACARAHQVPRANQPTCRSHRIQANCLRRNNAPWLSPAIAPPASGPPAWRRVKATTETVRAEHRNCFAYAWAKKQQHKSFSPDETLVVGEFLVRILHLVHFRSCRMVLLGLLLPSCPTWRAPAVLLHLAHTAPLMARQRLRRIFQNFV